MHKIIELCRKDIVCLISRNFTYIYARLPTYTAGIAYFCNKYVVWGTQEQHLVNYIMMVIVLGPHLIPLSIFTSKNECQLETITVLFFLNIGWNSRQNKFHTKLYTIKVVQTDGPLENQRGESPKNIGASLRAKYRL